MSNVGAGPDRKGIRGIGWLAHVPESFAERFIAACRTCRFAAGQAVYNPGDPPGGLYGVVSGVAEVSVAPHLRSPYPLHYCGPGFWIGQVSLFTGGARLAGLRAIRDCEMLHMPLARLERMLSDRPEDWRWFGLLNLLQLKIALGAIDDLMSRTTEQRCIAIMLRLAGCRRLFDDKKPEEPLDVTHEALAGMANASRNTLGSILRRLEDRGLIELRYREIRILDPRGLEAMLDTD